jgi:aconitate hydratase
MHSRNDLNSSGTFTQEVTQDAAIETIVVKGQSVRIFSIPLLAKQAGVSLDAVPFVGRILIEALLRNDRQAAAVTLAQRLASGEDAQMEMRFLPARVLVQDYTGVPLLVDLAAIRDAVRERGGAAAQVNPAIPVQLVVDHSVQVDQAGTATAQIQNELLEQDRNQERYAFLQWASQAFANLEVIPPGQGIVHQVNLERLATLVTLQIEADTPLAFPDTVIGTDSHTTMANGLGVLGWGVGGLEAESAMLGLAQPIAIPKIIGLRLSGRIQLGVTAADVVLALTQFLRTCDVGGQIIEFTGVGVDRLSAPDRCTISNMAPEYGAMAAFFPVDAETLRYLKQTGRSEDRLSLVKTYCQHQQLLRHAGDLEPQFSSVIEFDLSCVEVSLAGPSYPHQHLSLSNLAASFEQLSRNCRLTNQSSIQDGDIVIAAITSCTNTSNPSAMIAAGLLAQRAVEKGLKVPTHVKTSLAPGSRAVTHYLKAAGLLPALEALGFYVVGYGCTTCNGGSGTLAPDISAAIVSQNLAVCAVLSGNRNFTGRIHAQVQAAYLSSPAMVVALALVGHVRCNLETEPVGIDLNGDPVFLTDLYPKEREIEDLEAQYVNPECFELEPTSGDWQAATTTSGTCYNWQSRSTYIRRPPYLNQPLCTDEDTIFGARALVVLTDDVSTDHISPVGAIPPQSPAGQYLIDLGIAPTDLNSYGARRGNHEVMARGTFANPRLCNQMIPNVEGGYTLHLPTGDCLSIFDAASRYADTTTPLLILAGKRYGLGSSRDWAAKGPWLLGVRAVIAESFERIHHANLCAMGILPLLFPVGHNCSLLGIDGRETFILEGLNSMRTCSSLQVRARRNDGSEIAFIAKVDLHSSGEWEMLLQGGMLPYLLRNLEKS